MVEFVSYDGKYPALCCGELVLRIEGKEVNLGRCLRAGGHVLIDSDGCEYIVSDDWSVKVPEEFAQYTDEIIEVVNDNVPWGCCGGCI